MKRSKLIEDMSNEITFLDSNVTMHNAKLIADSLIHLLVETGVRFPPKTCRIVVENGISKHSQLEYGWDDEN